MPRNADRTRAVPFLMVGFEGTAVPPRLAAWLREGFVGGVVLFSRNLEGPAQVRELCREIRAAAGSAGPPPLIAIDQEGGRVRRLKDPGFTQFPPARSYSLFCCRAEQAANAVGAAAAAELRAVGIDINFAPVLDVDSHPRNPVIGDRSLSSDPEQAAALGIAFMRGSLSAGVLPVGKHFPGHGGTGTDSHKELPVVACGRDTLLSRDILPFRRAIRAGLPAVMTAHVLYTALDPDRPATLSPRILSDLLRGTLRFRGAVFSDALEMKAITGRMAVGEAAVAAVKAGCDALLVCRGEAAQDEAISALSRAVREEESFRRAAALSARRIRRLQDSLPPPRPGRRSLRSVGSRRHRSLAALLADRWEYTGRTSRGDRSGSIGEG
jgi:beta-N-acetylhexosaminidase